MKKTKLISVLVGGALTVGLAIGLAGCGNSNNGNGNQTSKSTSNKKVAEKRTFTIKEMNKYIKFVPNKNTKELYSGFNTDKTWGKIVVDSPYKNINGTLAELNEDEIPQNGEVTLESLDSDSMHSDSFSSNVNDYFDNKGVKINDGKEKDVGGQALSVKINDLKDPAELDWQSFLNQFDYSGHKPNLVAMQPDGRISVAYVDNTGLNYGVFEGNKLKAHDGKLESDLTKGDISDMNFSYETDHSGQSNEKPKDLNDAIVKITDTNYKQSEYHGVLLYNGTNLN
ncbi:hypothetical protein [Pediococcus acidilactici]|uniref:hypothetical protein n=1 Tax=Pediococcus acidilactici TaxID=1254 RepID=UPI001BD2ED3F|nr:hypothetical protein [Pediococcus acidilactici]MBS9398310.1 hypothetical protein [Pediococcus acidilactici]